MAGAQRAGRHLRTAPEIPKRIERRKNRKGETVYAAKTDAAG
jgi:hypothetical protein